MFLSSSVIWKTDVFVSFRGEDVRRTFASHLFCELDRMGIKAFRDDFDMERGKSISPELVDAIEGARFAIVVVSPNYASSSWCLDELAKIMECRDVFTQTVVPVFYEVDPSDVRKQTGSFGEDLERHGDKEKVRKWKEALTKLAAISGEDSRNWMDESKLIRKIVREISDQLVSVSSDGSEGLIGMDTHMEVLQSMMSNEHEEVRMIGIWGMGGVGKTTIARYLYNHISCRFQAHCFLENVKDVYNRHGVIGLQGEFLSKMYREKDERAWSSFLWCNMIKKRFQYKTVLIVLDDVDKDEQLNVLAKELDWFGPGSRIIVTTRDKHLLVSHGMEHVYKVKCLMKKEALQLFSHCAFRNDIVPSGFLELSLRAVNYASGLPLALRVLGSFLCKRSKREWESTFIRLETVPHGETMEVLRVSYNRLDEQEKVIFLFVACFFNMKHVDHVIKLLDICGYATKIGIEVLVEKSLMDISDGYIKMHDLLEQMGKELVRRQSIDNPGERLFLWDPKDIYDVLAENSGTRAVEAISVNMSDITEFFARDGAFEGLSNLKLLSFHYHTEDGDNKMHLPTGLSYLPHKIRYLRWDAYPLKTMPSSFQPESLVELCMRNSDLEKLWEGTQPLLNLKKMDLSHCKSLLEIPDLSRAINLEELNLSYCHSLVEVPPSIRHLHKLSCLYMTNCIQLKHFPERVILKSLETTDLNGCSSLMQFPEISRTIRRLYLKGTKVEELPSSIGYLFHLVELDLSDCQSLRTLPSTIGDLLSLKSMHLERCKRLGNLPNEIQNLKSLETLEVSGSLYINEFPHVATNVAVLHLTETAIEEVPTWICDISQLISLDISENKRLKYLPSGISELKSLQRLKLSGCSILGICLTVNCSSWFDIDRTGIREWHENIGSLITQAPSSILQLERLQFLSYGNKRYKPDSVSSLHPRLPRFDRLTVLCLSNLNMLEIPNSVANLWSLAELDLSGNNFKMIPAIIERLSGLYSLNVNDCRRLQAFPELPRSLVYIYAHGCTSLESISCCFRCCLHSLVLSNCFKLDQDAQLLIQLNMQLGSEKPEFAYFPGRDIPLCFDYEATGPLLKIHLPPGVTPDILGFSAWIMVGIEDQYPMDKLIIRCRCRFRGVYDYQVLMDDLWYPNPEAVRGICVGSDHLLLFSRCCTLVGEDADIVGSAASTEFLFEFSLGDPKEDSKPLWKVKKCAVRLISFENIVESELQIS